MKNYHPKTVLAFLNRVIEEHRADLSAPVHPENKIQWIRQTALKLLDLIEEESIKYNEQNPYNKIGSAEIVGAAQTMLNVILKNLGVKKKGS